MGVIENTPTGRLIFTIMSAFADFERDLIVERTQEGKAIARQKEGFREGRPNKYSKSQMKHALKLLENHSYKQVDYCGLIAPSGRILAPPNADRNSMRAEGAPL